MDHLQKIRKSSGVLTNPYYDTPKTSLLTFHFERELFDSCIRRFKKCSIHHKAIDKKDVYYFDDFFEKEEAEKIRVFSKNTSFSNSSYGSSEAFERGEKPARTMNNKERWIFFSKPPKPIQEIYKLLGTLAYQLNAEICTLPWELCDLKTGSPAVIANFIQESSEESMNLGKHQDSNPEKGIAFGIPILYSEKEEFHESQFINGDIGKPWLVSMMLYSTADNFQSKYQMGTVFYNQKQETALRIQCINARLILFEGDIFHSIDESKVSETTHTWRVSYVYKLCFNPRKKNQSIKKDFFNYMQSLKQLSK